MNISQAGNHFTGNKVNIHEILNEVIEVHDYKIVPSKLPTKEGTRCMHLQIARQGTKHVIFTGSEILMSQIEQVPKDKIPFTATIKKKERMFYFS